MTAKPVFLAIFGLVIGLLFLRFSASEVKAGCWVSAEGCRCVGSSACQYTCAPGGCGVVEACPENFAEPSPDCSYGADACNGQTGFFERHRITWSCIGDNGLSCNEVARQFCGVSTTFCTAKGGACSPGSTTCCSGLSCVNGTCQEGNCTGFETSAADCTAKAGNNTWTLQDLSSPAPYVGSAIPAPNTGTKTQNCINAYGGINGACFSDGCPNWNDSQNSCEVNPNKGGNSTCDWCPYTDPGVPGVKTGICPGDPAYSSVNHFSCSYCKCGQTTVAPPSCSFNLSPSTASIGIGQTQSYFAANVNLQNATSASVAYSSSDSTIAKLSTTSTSVSPYSTSATGLKNSGANPVTINATMTVTGSTGQTATCSSSSQLTVTNPVGWWQVRDTDVIAAGASGNISSSVPARSLFDLQGLGGYPGLPRYAVGPMIPSVPELISIPQWNANSDTNFRRAYDYTWFRSRIPSDVSGSWTQVGPGNNCTAGASSCNLSGTGGYFNSGAVARGYAWYYYDGTTYGDLIMSTHMNINGSRRAVLLVDGADVVIKSPISINNPGQGFFMIIAGKRADGSKGNIIIDPNNYVQNGFALEGIFYADGAIKTGTFGTSPGTDNQLRIRGAVAGYGGVNLQRNLPDNTVPAEFIQYAPDLMILYPDVFKVRRTRWREVVP